MIRKTAPLILKIGEELIEVLLTNIAKNIELDNDKYKDVQSFIDNLKLDLKEISKQLAEKLTQEDIVNSLNSDETNKALSAAQGRYLYQKIQEIEKYLDSQGAKIKDIDELSLHLYNYSPLSREENE